MVRTLDSTAGGLGSIPDHGTKILQAIWHNQIKRKENKWFINTDLVTSKSFCYNGMTTSVFSDVASWLLPHWLRPMAMGLWMSSHGRCLFSALVIRLHSNCILSSLCLIKFYFVYFYFFGHIVWDLSWPGIELMPPALGTTGSSGKSLTFGFLL